MSITARTIRAITITARSIIARTISAAYPALFINGVLQSNGILIDSTILGEN